MGLLAKTSLVVLLVIISMRIIARKEEVEILNLIGATPSFIRSPILIEAIIYATLGAFLGWAISFIMVLYSAPAIVSYFGEIPILPKDALGIFELFGIILLVEIAFGILLATAGSMLAVSRVKKAR